MKKVDMATPEEKTWNSIKIHESWTSRGFTSRSHESASTATVWHQVSSLSVTSVLFKDGSSSLWNIWHLISWPSVDSLMWRPPTPWCHSNTSSCSLDCMRCLVGFGCWRSENVKLMWTMCVVGRELNYTTVCLAKVDGFIFCPSARLNIHFYLSISFQLYAVVS